MRALPYVGLTALLVAAACGGSSSATDDAPASGGSTQGAAGSPQAGGAGASQAGKAGSAQAGKAGTTQSAGASQAGQAGASQAGQAGASQAGQAGASQAGQAGGSQAGQAGAAQAGQAGQTGASGQAGAAGQGGAVGGSTIRFVAIGDQGTASDGQKAVGNAMANKCAADGCDFALLLGDNFYDDGVGSTTDSQWQTKFVEPYAAMSMPFYAVLGNHDNGGNGAGWDFGRGDNQVAYTKVNPKWQMPARHYRFTKGPVEFFALDTNQIFYGLGNDQRSNVSGWIAESTAPWRVALGHHPYLSNGKHGNAGIYEGIPFVPITSGQAVKDFFDSTICGKVDIYLSGHDHSIQWLESTCQGTHLIVSGAGAKTTSLGGKNKARYETLDIGFFYVVMDDKTFYAEVLDSTGKVAFSHTLTK